MGKKRINLQIPQKKKKKKKKTLLGICFPCPCTGIPSAREATLERIHVFLGILIGSFQGLVFKEKFALKESKFFP